MSTIDFFPQLAVSENNKSLGQYFTPNYMANFMIKLSSKNKESEVLEPSSGKGAFIKMLLENGYSSITAYEVDKSLIQEYQDIVVNESFVSAEIKRQFDLVIGNPPYIRWKNLTQSQKDELNSNKYWAM